MATWVDGSEPTCPRCGGSITTPSGGVLRRILGTTYLLDDAHGEANSPYLCLTCQQPVVVPRNVTVIREGDS